MKTYQVLLLLIGLASLSTLPAPASHSQAAEQALNYAPGNADTCLICHRNGGPVPAEDVLKSPHGISANPNSPFATGQHHCQSCHGPSADHLRAGADGKRPSPAVVFTDTVDADTQNPDTQNQVCLNCHRSDVGNEWHGGVHQFEQLSCSNCHQIHVSSDPILDAKQQASVCFTCHQQQRAELLRQSAHPVERGLLGCGDCHAAHGGSSSAGMLKKSNTNELCYDCHAEKRGPVLWEHAPVREDCSNCHQPHGSNHNGLLVARPPFLCQQCHLAQFHPSTSFSGDDIPPNGASRLLLNRNCMNCHTQVHGSNHPSGAGLIR
jgi:DmsE family decaheme c-type cytochrome